MIVNRAFASEQRARIKNKWYVVVITWQRRSWKSTFLKQLADETDRVLAIDFERMEFDALKTYTELYTYIINAFKKSSCTLLTIDEIQKVDQRERAILSILKEFPEINIVITGSNSHLLSGDLTTYLRGRYMQIHLLPFSYQEYCTYHEVWISPQSFFAYCEQWAFPGAYRFDLAQHKEWIDSLINTIFVKDIIERYKVRQVSVLRELFLYLVYNAGNLTNITKITTYLIDKWIVTNRNTISEYITYLIDAFMIYPCEVYDIAGKSLFDRLVKFYPSDHCRRKVLFGAFDDWWSKVLETMFYSEALRQWRRVQVGRIQSNEIDFILTKWWEQKYVQVCYQLSTPEVVAREFDVFDKLSTHYPKYVLSCDPISLGNRNGVEHVLFWEMEKVFR
jgi:uncharacterized protein